MTRSPSNSIIEKNNGSRQTQSATPIILALAAAAFLMILNETVLSVAIPQLMDNFAITASTAQWLTTGFLLTMAITIPTTGYLFSRFTSRQLFTVAVGLFALGTLCAAIAPSFLILLGARVIQAFGTAITLPLLMASTLALVSPARRGAALGLNSVVISVAPAIGPTISGVVISMAGWRWLFGGLFVLTLIVLLIGIIVVRIPAHAASSRLDIVSILLSAFGFGGVVYFLATLGTEVTTSWVWYASLVVGVIALGLFVVRQYFLQRSKGAFLDLRPFWVKNFRIGSIILITAMSTMLGSVMVLPLFFQQGLGLSVLVTGLLLLPGGLIQGLCAPVVGRLFDIVGPRPLVIPGTVLLAVGMAAFGWVSVDTPIVLIVAANVVFSLGMALTMTPLMGSALGALPAAQYGHGSAILNTLQQVAGAAGTALFVALYSLGVSSGVAPGTPSAVADGTRLAFCFGAVVALVGFFLSFRIRALKGPRLRESSTTTATLPREEEVSPGQ